MLLTGVEANTRMQVQVAAEPTHPPDSTKTAFGQEAVLVMCKAWVGEEETEENGHT